LGIGDWGLAQSPIPNPQSPIEIKNTINLSDVLDSVMRKQINECKYHNTTSSIYSFFNDHTCPKTLIPYKLIYSLENHNEEILNIVFSNSMKYIAVILKSNSIVIYKLSRVPSNNINKQSIIEVILVNSILNPHSSMITSLHWKNDDSCILTSSKDKLIKIFDPFKGFCKLTIDRHRDMVSSAIFVSNDTRIISSSLDYKISLWDLSGGCDFTISLPGLTVSELHYSALYNYVIIISATTNSILFYNLETREEIYKLPMNDVIISCATSKLDDGGHLLVNSSKATPVLNLINLKNYTQIERKYFGHRQERFNNKCSFGGQSENFLLCGSEDARIYIWNRHHSIPISSIKVHSAPVNAVIWASNEYTDLLISCSEDHTIKFLGNENLEKVQEGVEIKEEFNGTNNFTWPVNNFDKFNYKNRYPY
jgi:WD repeat-containing protein 26